KVAYIKRAHVAVSTSEKEGWGLTVLEANACGVPVVASDVPGLRDAVRDGQTGILGPHQDVARLANALRDVLQDAAHRERLSAGALAWAQGFSWDAAAADIVAVVEDAAAAWEGRAAAQAPLPRTTSPGPQAREPLRPPKPTWPLDTAPKEGGYSG